jgi:hypothetical protein
MKPYWFSWTTFGISLCNLLAKIFVMIFMEVLSKDMGLKSFTVFGLCFLGTRVI